MRRSALFSLTIVLLGGCGLTGVPQVPALPPGTNDCIGLERAKCLELLESYASSRNVEPVAWRIRCTGVCGPERGDVELTITWADGSTESAAMGWVGALGAPPGVRPQNPAGPIPTPPVPPSCLRVPREQCDAEWLTSLQDLTEEQRAGVAAVEVECRTECTLVAGDGRTTVVLDDGKRIEISDWSYRRGQ